MEAFREQQHSIIIACMEHKLIYLSLPLLVDITVAPVVSV